MRREVTYFDGPPRRYRFHKEGRGRSAQKSRFVYDSEGECNTCVCERIRGDRNFPLVANFEIFFLSSVFMEHETLSRDHPISEFIRHQKNKMTNLSEEEFTDRFESHLKEFSDRREDKPTSSKSRLKKDEIVDHEIVDHASSQSRFQGERLTSIVLKFTTLSEANSEAPSFFVGTSGAKIGRDTTNEINVPSDVRLAPVAHSLIQYLKGHFYIIDCGYDFAASVRIGVGGHKNKWVIEEGSQFSAGIFVQQYLKA